MNGGLFDLFHNVHNIDSWQYDEVVQSEEKRLDCISDRNVEELDE